MRLVYSILFFCFSNPGIYKREQNNHSDKDERYIVAFFMPFRTFPFLSSTIYIYKRIATGRRDDILSAI